MRIKITIELSEKRFPADYRRAFLHLMQNALSTYMNGIYFQDFFRGDVRSVRNTHLPSDFRRAPSAGESISIWGKTELSPRSRQGILPAIFYYIMHSAI